MFRKLKEAIDAALTALEGGGDAAGDIDDLLAGMREELIEAKAATPKLEQGLENLRRREAEEQRRAEDCVRRAGQAEEIGDTETMRVAVEFAEKHQERARVYGEQMRAAEAELALHRASVKEMTSAFKEAVAKKDAIKVQGRRARATESLRGGGDSAASRFDRMAADIEAESDLAEATRELDDELEHGGPGRGAAYDPVDPDDLADLQLEELKRRMAEEGRDSGGS